MEASTLTPTLVGDVAIITGGGSGIGLGIAECLGRAGARVVLVDRDGALAERSARELCAAGIESIGIGGDVCDASDVERAMNATREAFGPPRILVNNAGLAEVKLLVDTSEELWDAVIDVSLKGTFLWTRAFARRAIEETVSGAVVNLASLNYVAPTDGMSHYCAAKAGVVMFTQVVAGELARHGIRVNAIAPGTTRTRTTEETGRLEGLMGREFLARTPLGRLGVPEDLGKAAVFLCSDQADWITGETLLVDGGAHLKGLHSYWDVMQEEMAQATLPGHQ